MTDIEEAIIKTLCYRDLFDYPLTAKEITEFLIEHSASSSQVEQVLARMVAEGKVGELHGYHYLSQKKSLVSQRQRREKISERKWGRALKRARILRFFPWVRAVFLTGALAAGNAGREADLDFLIITRRNRVWLTRLIAYLVFSGLGWKRPRGVEEAPDRVCLNMFLAEDALAVPEEEHNLFTAHEVALARPLWARDYLHRRFLGENPWVRKFLPNLAIPAVKIPAPRSYLRSIVFIFDLADGLSRQFQLLYMSRRRTREVVERQRILFHPNDLSREILSAFKVRVFSQLHRSPLGEARLGRQSRL